jgi:hypothetical protein
LVAAGSVAAAGTVALAALTVREMRRAAAPGAATPPAGAPLPGEPASPTPTPATPDQALVGEKLAFAREEGLHALPLGEGAVRLGQTFIGTPYVAAALEAPGDERLVVNLRELDCVTFVECVLALARVARAGAGRARGAAAEYAAFEDELRRLRYRGGVIAGYVSRLHYFSEWIADNERRGVVRDVARELGGVRDARPLTFMSAHPQAYGQLAAPEQREAIRRVEEALSARPRYHVPRDRLAAALPRIANGDVLAATTSIDGLDVVHTALALWRGSDLHLLHAPDVGEAVRISRLPVAEWMRLQRQQTGLMVARPV